VSQFAIVSSFALILPTYVSGDDARGQKWSDAVFESLSHDFGTVAKGYSTKQFKITNTMDKAIHIFKLEARGWFDTRAPYVYVSVEKEWIDPGESVWLNVGVQTLRQSGKGSAVLIVTFDQPKYGSSYIRLNWFARSDVVFNPSRISFGAVKNAIRTERAMTIEYAGDFDWTIAAATCKNPDWEVRLDEKHRDRADKGYATVGYELTVSLRPGTPPGRLQELVRLEINDPLNKTLDVVVDGTVEAEEGTQPK
jgi:hypothetical protein